MKILEKLLGKEKSREFEEKIHKPVKPGKLFDEYQDLEDELIAILKRIEGLLQGERKTNFFMAYNRISTEGPERDMFLLHSLLNISKISTNVSTGFYLISTEVNLPFYPGDILFFSKNSSLKNGDFVLVWWLSSDEKLPFNHRERQTVSLNYAKYLYTKEGTNDLALSTPYSNQPYELGLINYIGKIIPISEFGTKEWQGIIEAQGIAKEKIVDDLTKSIKAVYDTPNFIEREKTLTELKRRKKLLSK